MNSHHKVLLQPGVVLHHQPYRNTSMLLDIFTPEHGRVSLVAKGARRPKSASYGLLQPFRPLLFSWSGRTELMTLTGVEADGKPRDLRGKFLFSGYYLNELLMRLLHRFDPHRDLYYHYHAALNGLQQLGQAEDDARRRQRHEGLLRAFEKTLLQEIGYGLILDHNVETGEPIDSETGYYYILEQGPVRAQNVIADGIRLSGRSLLALQNDALDDEGVLKDCKRLMRSVLAYYLGDKPLHTRSLMHELDEQAQRPLSRANEDTKP